MSDLIDRKAAIDAIKYADCALISYWDAQNAMKILEDLPSAQPEPIRCKDCRYYYKDIGAYQNIECQCDNWYTGTLTGDLIGVCVEPYDDFFCGFAERREDDEVGS